MSLVESAVTPEAVEDSAYERVRTAVTRYKGQKVRVPKGTFVRSMHPHDPTAPTLTRRSQTVTVHHVSINQKGDIVLIWAGSGNYWKDVRAQDVELCP
jgi:hypothetical protein